jgi:putative OPT family oligopeptide transporter
MPAVEFAAKLWSTKTRYIGVGGMLVGGLWTIFHMRASLLSGITSGLKAYRNVATAQSDIPRTEKDMPMKWILVLIIASVVPLYLVYQVFVQDVTISVIMAVIMLVAGFVFSAVAGYMAGLVGSSNNPISGVTIATILVSALLLVLLMGKGAVNGPAAAIIIGSVVCCAAAIAGDNMQDLKAGYIVGATPWRQQVMQLVGVISGAVVIAPVLTLLQKAYGFAGEASATERALPAPQANLMASVANGVFHGGLPWSYVFIGMIVAVAIIILDQYLQSKGSTFRTPVLAVAIGFYLPFELSVPIFAGGLIHHAIKIYNKKNNLPQERIDKSARNGLLFASGLITGEALMGILLAIPIVLLAKRDISLPLWDDIPGSKVIGIVILAGIAYWLYRTIASQKEN